MDARRTGPIAGKPAPTGASTGIHQRKELQPIDNPIPTGQLGRTVVSATCLDGADAGHKLFRVEPGNCCDHVLERASILMDCARRTSLIGVLDEEPVLVLASHFLGAMARALMDDAHLGLRKAN